MRPRPLRRLNDQIADAGVFGSLRAAEFLRDAVNFTDSVDIITIGDSNAGQGATCGYQFGVATACAINQIPVYATPLTFTATSGGANARVGGMWLPLNRVNWLGVDGNMSKLRTRAAASDAQALALEAVIGYNTSNLPVPYSFTYDAAFVASGLTYTSGAYGAAYKILRPSPMTEGTGAGGTSCQYRLVHGVWQAAGSGQFKLGVYRGTNTRIAESAAFIPTNGAAANGYATAKLDFTSPTVAGAPVEFFGAFDGYNATPANYQITGPFCALWHSIIEKRKGFSISNLTYRGGAMTSAIADDIENMNELLTMYLKELRERQIEATGSGRVIVWCNTGVNGPDTGSSWTTAAARIRDRFVAKWVTTLGYPASDLAFIFSVTHPQSAGATETTLAATRLAANEWAGTSSNNVMVVDISRLFTYTQLSNRRLYQSTANAENTAHLSETWGVSTSVAVQRFAAGYDYDVHILNNGYVVVANAMLRSMLQRVS